MDHHKYFLWHLHLNKRMIAVLFLSPRSPERALSWRCVLTPANQWRVSGTLRSRCHGYRRINSDPSHSPVSSTPLGGVTITGDATAMTFVRDSDAVIGHATGILILIQINLGYLCFCWIEERRKRMTRRMTISISLCFLEYEVLRFRRTNSYKLLMLSSSFVFGTLHMLNVSLLTYVHNCDNKSQCTYCYYNIEVK